VDAGSHSRYRANGPYERFGDLPPLQSRPDAGDTASLPYFTARDAEAAFERVSGLGDA
jgi:hypothetical protein